jgi:ribulose bisphosphate carboxylase small subunit
MKIADVKPNMQVMYRGDYYRVVGIDPNERTVILLRYLTVDRTQYEHLHKIPVSDIQRPVYA